MSRIDSGYGRDDRNRIVGAGRDVGVVTRSLLAGRSVVVGGVLGAGKSFFVDRVVDALEARGVSPLLVRGAAALADIRFGALDVAADPRARALRDDAPLPEGTLVVVDDAHELDDDSLTAVLRAVYAHRAPAMLAVTEPRFHSHPTRHTLDPINELWLRGIADRIDIDGLRGQDADDLLDLFAPDTPVDSVTRAAIRLQTDGSRVVLRSLADTAGAALREGRDPLSAIDHAPAHSRLAVALQAHVREFDDASIRAMILVDRAAGISLADASRFVPIATLEALRAAGLLHSDESIVRGVSGNRLIARAVERSWGRERTDAFLCDVIARFVRDRGTWWSRPLARLLAEQWLRDARGPGALPDVPDEVISRVVVAAAREANDRGDAALAAAYADWAAPAAFSPALSVEKELADGLLGRTRGARTPASSLDAEARHRARIVDLILGGPEHPGATADRDGAPRDLDAAPSWERDAAAAQRALTEMRTAECSSLVERMSAPPEDDPRADVDTQLLRALSAAYLGQDARMQRALEASRRVLSSGRARDLATERLSARCVELICATIAGTDDRRSIEMLGADRDGAVRTASDLALAGFASVLEHVRRGRVLEAQRELSAAVRRSPQLTGEPWDALHLHTAFALALFGRAAEARDVLAAREPAAAMSPLLHHARAETTATLAASEQDWDAAHDAAHRAWTLSSDTDAFMLQIRDLHRLVVLRHPDAPASLHRLRELAAAVPAPAAEVFAASAERAAASSETDRDAILAHLRLDLCPPALADGRERRSRLGGTGTVHPEILLTPRELEIARLVATGLSNRAIAEGLFLSVRTVESHIYQARAKVEVGSRHELGALVAPAA